MTYSRIALPAVLALAVSGCRDSGPGGDGDGSTGGGDESGGITTTGHHDTGSDGGTTAEPLECPEVKVAEQPLRRITRAQYRNTLRDVLGVDVDVDELEGDEKSGPFDSNSSAPVSNVMVEQYRLLAEDLASAAMADMDAFLPCAPTDAACELLT